MDNAGKKRKRSQYGLRDLSSMKITRLIGDGTYGMVFSAQDKETGETVALKKIKMEQETQGFPVTAIREMKILKALNHENIIALREMITYEKEDAETDGSLVNMKVQLSVGDVFMVFEFAEYDLAGLINEVTFTDDHIKSYTKQLLDGIHFMHRNRILHRDIKGANILVTVDNKIKIADLGLARSYISTENRFTSNNKVVTRWYRSPELLLEAQKYGPEIDIWSIGCLFAELKERQATLKGNSDLHQLELVYQLCGTPLAPGASPSSGAYVAENTSTHKLPVLDGTVYNIYKELPGWEKCTISNTYPPIFTTRFCKFAPLAANLLSQMLAMNPAQRITAADALNHNYFWQSKIPRAEELPRFNDIKCGHEYEARLKRNAEHTARQREHAQLVAKQSQHFQPHYNTASRNPSYPGHQQHGFAASNPNPVAHAPANAYIRSGNPSGHGGRGSRSSQGLTKGFKIVPASSSSSNAPPK